MQKYLFSFLNSEMNGDKDSRLNSEMNGDKDSRLNSEMNGNKTSVFEVANICGM